MDRRIIRIRPYANLSRVVSQLLQSCFSLSFESFPSSTSALAFSFHAAAHRVVFVPGSLRPLLTRYDYCSSLRSTARRYSIAPPTVLVPRPARSGRGIPRNGLTQRCSWLATLPNQPYSVHTHLDNRIPPAPSLWHPAPSTPLTLRSSFRPVSLFGCFFRLQHCY